MNGISSKNILLFSHPWLSNIIDMKRSISWKRFPFNADSSFDIWKTFNLSNSNEKDKKSFEGLLIYDLPQNVKSC